MRSSGSDGWSATDREDVEARRNGAFLAADVTVDETIFIDY